MKKIISVLLAVIMMCGTFVPVCLAAGSGEFTLIVPENWEMDIGDSRSVDYAFPDDVTNRVLTWKTEPADVASVDVWGRVTALKEGKVTVTASTSDGLTDSAELNVVKEATKIEGNTISKKDYQGKAAAENEVLQKIVTRHKIGSKAVPSEVADPANYAKAQTATTADGAVWEITNYGVLRTDANAANDRDKEQRFMGDRYFAAMDTTDGKVLAIFADGKYGIWTVMAEGYTHIEMVKLNGTDKAAKMSATTQEIVSRRGMVAEAFLENGKWVPCETDNDGLWTAMYGGGELMRYAVLRDDPNTTPEELEEAKKAAYLSAEAVLFLTYVSMREGTVESYVRAQRNGSVTEPNTGKYYSSGALLANGDYSAYVPYGSPADRFAEMRNKYMIFGSPSYLMNDDNLAVFAPESWVDPLQDPNQEYAKRTRNLEGFWARTYSFKQEMTTDGHYDGYIYWSHNGDGTATGVSSMKEEESGYYLNGENLRGVKVNATKDIPERLWNDLIGSGYDVEDIVYKGDTSSDEVIGHLFIYKLAYDILGPEDEELRQLIVHTMDMFAQHIVDNGYSLVDGSGQPTTWSKFNRTYLHNGQVLGGAALQTSVILSALKLAAYVTGDQKWEDEYRMAALHEQYEYATIMTQEMERYEMSIFEFTNSVSPILGFILRPLVNTNLFKTIYRLILNYSDEEMAMLAYYLLFQMEDDEELLTYYRSGLEDWWYSISHSENPLWYYVYQLAHPEEEQKDIYGNSLIETAAWSLSRHPIDTIRYMASNKNRDDIAAVNLSELGLDTEPLSFDAKAGTPLFWNSDNDILKIAGIVISAAAGNIKWAVAAPDERSMHKYNGSSYRLDGDYNPNQMEGSTTYTLPYWMGRYHGMLEG
ncbi:MAG: Ig-like domain-containing protein [Clostridia bacterium]|nr:Ig-like domain-containing protein [Clostridia bacterium]